MNSVKPAADSALELLEYHRAAWMRVPACCASVRLAETIETYGLRPYWMCLLSRSRK